MNEPNPRERSHLLIHTIGHSNHSIERFIGLIRAASIETLVDVRSYPGSRFHPQFNRAALTQALEVKGIAYRWLGDALGGKPKNKTLLGADGRPDYAKMTATSEFGTGIETFMTLASGSSCAIMCAEEDPARCHRNLLVAPALSIHGIGIRHIRGDGRLVDRAAAEPARQQDLFG